MPAVKRLTGLTLNNGWLVKNMLEKSKDDSGGMFSVSYVVERDGKDHFLKAFDFSDIFMEPNPDIMMSKLRNATEFYENEKEILHLCKDRRLSRVVVALDHGDVTVAGMDNIAGRVLYIVFDLADGNMRNQINRHRRLDTLSCVKALKDVTLGLNQIHRYQIAHQDMKPSNVLSFRSKADGYKIADLGRSTQKGSAMALQMERWPILGDKTYSPPELLYGHIAEDFAPRRVGCDMYMLGNMVAFIFTGGANITAGIEGNLAPEHRWHFWSGNYADVLPYVTEAFSRYLEEIADSIDSLIRAQVVPIIRELCNPDLSRRGHPRAVGTPGQYSLERYLNVFDQLTTRVEIALRTGKVLQ